MKLIKRITSLILVVVFAAMLFCGCNKNKTDDSVYLTKGEFFAYVVHEYNMSSKIHSVEEINNCYDGTAEADVIAEWGYLPDELAHDKLNKPVTKEIVTMVLANATFDLIKGEISDIKDAGKLHDPQLIADAYASGLTELENGYFNAEKKMTFADCENAMDIAREYTADFHYEPNTGEYEVADDLIVYDGENYSDGDITIELPEEGLFSDDESNNGNLSFVDGKGFITNLGYAHKADDTYFSLYGKRKTNIVNRLSSGALNNSIVYSGLDGFSATIRKNVFEKELGNPSVGDTILLSKYQVAFHDNRRFLSNEIMGILVGVRQDRGNYYCSFKTPDFEHAVQKKNPVTGNVSGIGGFDFKKELDEYMGWKLDFQISDKSVSVSASHKFTVYETGRKQDWQNAQKTIEAKAVLTLSDFNVDVNNLKSFATGEGSGYIKIQCDTAMDFSLSTSLRYTPDDNRNGHFPANWNNSRWTNSDAKGAKEIKIARFTPTNGVVGANIYIYLRISVDGKVSFRTSVDDGGVKIVSNNGNIGLEKLGKKKTEASANVNLIGRLGIDAKLLIFAFINVIEYDVGVTLNALGSVDLYYEDKLESPGVFADEEGLNELAASDGKFNYCIDIVAKLSVTGEMKDCAVKLVLDALNLGSSLNFSFDIWTWGLHFEDGSWVDECTRGKGGDETTIDILDEDDITLSTYKVIMDNYTCTTVDLGAIPSEAADFYNSTNSIVVRSNNESVVKASFNKKTKTIILEAVGDGSTEITIIAKKGILWWKETVEQKISVTVNPYYDSVTDYA